MKLPKITIYDRYIFKQVLFATIAAIMLFTIVWIAPEMLLSTIKDALAGDYSMKTAILFLVYEIPKILGKAFPVGLLLGTLFTFDKLSKDSELTIFRAVGMSFARIIAPVLVLSVIVTYLCYFTGDKMIPFSADKIRRISGSIQQTQFIYTQKDDNGHPTNAIVVSKSKGKNLYNVIVLDFSNEVYSDVHQLSTIYFAKTGQVLDDKWLLNDIVEYSISRDGVFSDISQFKELSVLEGDYAKNAYTLMSYSTKKEREINVRDMGNYIKLLKAEGLDEEYRYMLNKYFQRFLHPLVCILLAILGCLLGFSKPREQRLIGFTIAIACIFAYYITLPFFDLLAEKGVLPPLITAAFPPLAFLAAIFAFYKAKDL